MAHEMLTSRKRGARGAEVRVEARKGVVGNRWCRHLTNQKVEQSQGSKDRGGPAIVEWQGAGQKSRVPWQTQPPRLCRGASDLLALALKALGAAVCDPCQQLLGGEGQHHVPQLRLAKARPAPDLRQQRRWAPLEAGNREVHGAAWGDQLLQLPSRAEPQHLLPATGGCWGAGKSCSPCPHIAPLQRPPAGTAGTG